MKIILIIILMFGVAESRTAVVFGTNYSTISSVNDWEDDWEDDGIDVDLEYFMGGRIGLESISKNLITGFTYSQRGFSMTGQSEYDASEASITFIIDYLTAYGLIQVPIGSLALLAGGEAGYWLSTEMTAEIDGVEVTEEVDDDDWEEAGGHTLDYGIVLGAKFDVSPKLSAVGTCYFGLPEWGSDDDYGIDYKNRGFQIYLSYAIM